MEQNTTDYSIERAFLELLGLSQKNDIAFWNQNDSKYEMYDAEYLLSKFKQQLIYSVTDEEIESAAKKMSNDATSQYLIGLGAKWLLEQLKQKL